MINGKSGRGVFAPSYYNDFKCISSACKRNCCIDWEIYIDEETYAKYKKIKSISSTVIVDEEGPRFVLGKDGRCPHLNEKGLCDVILSLGEDFLCEICQNHPRFFNRINEGRVEIGLGMVCEEACRLILENKEPFSLSKIQEIEEFYGIEGCENHGEKSVDFDILAVRDRIFSVILGEGDFDEKLRTLKKKFDLSEPFSLDEWFSRFLTLEILDPDWEKDLKKIREKVLKKRDEKRKTPDGFEKYYARLLAYFVYRHVSVAEDFEELQGRLSFSILSAEFIRLLFESGKVFNLENLVDWARRYSAEIEYSEDNTEELIFAFENAR